MVQVIPAVVAAVLITVILMKSIERDIESPQIDKFSSNPQKRNPVQDRSRSDARHLTKTESQNFQVDSPSAVNQHEVTLNHLDGKTYPHHPVMLTVGRGPYPVANEFLTEINGLKVPAEFDCDMFFRPDEYFQSNVLARLQDKLPGSKERIATKKHFWGAFHYFTEVQSRFHACWLHLADLNSGMTLMRPHLPIVDDEYNEQVSVYQSVLRAKKKFVIAELGARWGTWGTRSIQFLKHVRPELPYSLYMVEANEDHCAGMDRVIAANNIVATTKCGYAEADSFRAWADTQKHIDLIDFDIQEAEETLVPAVMDILNDKVYRVILGTHAPWPPWWEVNRTRIHDKMVKLFEDQGWIFIFKVAPTKDYKAMDRAIRGQNVRTNENLFNWDKLLRNPKAYHTTPRGPVAHADGELVLDNPRFVDKDKVFSLDDTVLKVDDLK